MTKYIYQFPLTENKFLFSFGSFLLFISGIFAQQANPVVGGFANGIGGSSNYTIGQVFYTTNFGITNFSSAQGEQQPFEINTTLDTPNFKDILLSFSVYPNPTVNFLTLNSPNYLDYNLNYSLYDVNGKILISKKIQQKTIKINLSHLKSAIYFLNISDRNMRHVKTFRILKN